MILLEGRCVEGLDEFMLRIGHLKVLCNTAIEVGGPHHRLMRAMAEILTHPTPVDSSMQSVVGEYLAKKRLCCLSQQPQTKTPSRDTYRYPELSLVSENDAWVIRSIESAQGHPHVWWQDFCLCQEEIPSKVGAITVSAKAGSKTGLSHLFDWAQRVGLLSHSRQPSPVGKLAAKLGGQTEGVTWHSNPYMIRNDKIILGFALLSADMDLSSRYIMKLASSSFPLRKRDAARIYAETVQELVEESERAGYTTARQRYLHADLLRDLVNATRRKSDQIGDTSTAWHRASSRMESYVDLGLLTKSTARSLDKYEYTYYGTSALVAAHDTLKLAMRADDWLEAYLVSVLNGTDVEVKATLDDLQELLPPVLAAICSPAPSLPIDAIGLGWTKLMSDTGRSVSIKTARRLLLELARRRPDVARLSRGTSGERAEFISIDIRKLRQ